MTELLIAFLTGVLGPLIVIFVRHRLETNKAKSDPVRETLEVGNLVVAKIDSIKEEFDADRVWIAQFHNGGHFYPTGKSIAKFSVIYESLNQGVKSLQPSLQNIPVNLFARSLNQLLNNDEIVIYDFLDNEIATYGLKYLAEDSGCKSGYFFAIKTIEDKFIGVLGVDYVDNKTSLNAEQINELAVYASSIGGVLINHLQK
jgi:hypothetical protein